MRHIKHNTDATGVMISFSSRLFDIRFMKILSPKYAVKIHVVHTANVRLSKIVITSARSSTIIKAKARTSAEKKLAMRNFIGNTLCFPPHAALPSGTPIASSIWKHIIPKNITAVIQAATCSIIMVTDLVLVSYIFYISISLPICSQPNVCLYGLLSAYPPRNIRL